MVTVAPGHVCPPMNEALACLTPLARSLRVLTLSGNRVGGDINNISTLVKLTHIDFQDCDLAQPNMETVFELLGPLTGLKMVNLSGNPRLGGNLHQLPALRESLKELAYLKLGSTGLSGTISVEVLRSLCGMKEFDICGNSFSNESIDLSGTGLAGEVLEKVLTQLALQPRLTSLDLSSCRLNDALVADGWLQNFVIDCPLLKTLLLRGANLTGEVDANLFTILLRLDTFDLCKNQLDQDSVFGRLASSRTTLKGVPSLSLEENTVHGPPMNKVRVISPHTRSVSHND